MMKILEMFPYVMPDELQLEVDKQTHLYEGVYSWLENVKHSLLRGEDDAQVFRAPKTPVLRRKYVRRIKPIPEEVGDDADNSFDISSSSAQSSVSSCKSIVSTTKSLRTAALKANLQIKTQVNTNLHSKLRQPSSEGEVCLQNSVQTLLETFPQNGKPSSKRICLERDSTVGCTVLVKTNEKSGDSHDTLLSEISSIAREAGKMLENASISSQSLSGTMCIAPSGCRSSVASTESERGHDPPTRCKRTRNKRARSKALKDRQNKNESIPEKTVEGPNSSVVEQESNLLADYIVESSLCDGIMVKRIRKDTVSVMPSRLSLLKNDHKLKLKPVVSLSHVNLSNFVNDGTVVGTLKNEQSDALNKASDLDETKTNNVLVCLVESLIGQNAVVSSEGVGMTEQSDPAAPGDDVIKHSSAVVIHGDAMVHGDVLGTKECVRQSRQAVAMSRHGSPVGDNRESVRASRQAVAMSTQASPINDGAISSQAEKKNRQESDSSASSCKFIDTVNDSKFETMTETLNRNSGSLANNVASQDSASVQKKLLHCNIDRISDQNDDQLICEDTTFTVENVNEKQREVKAGCERKTRRNSLGTPKNATFTSPAHSLLDSTLKNASGKKLSPATALCDISNTMNTSASLRENVLKDFKKASQNVDSSYIYSTPVYPSSSYPSSGLSWSCKVVLNDKLGGSHSKKQEHPRKKPTSRSPVIFSPYNKVSVKNRVAKFENLNALMEATDENTDPVVPPPPPSGRVTRTKTRAMAAAAAAEAASKTTASNMSLCEPSLKNVSATQNAARKSLKKALRMSAAKSKKGCFTPNTSHDENKMVNALMSSMKKYNNIVVGLDTLLPRANKGPTAAELDRKKEEEQRRQKERAEEACRKREIMLNAKAQEKKRRNEEKLQKVAEKREAQQREEQERRQRQEREREEKLQRLMQTRDEKQREELLMKRMQLQQKLQEVEERRRQEEAARLARLREQEEQEARRKEQLEKERAAEKEAAAREQQALLQKWKSNAPSTSRSDSTKRSMQETAALNQTYKVEEVTSYKISDVGANSEDELTIKHAVPKWAKRYQKAASCFSEFMAYTYVPEELVHQLFGGSEDPDLTRLLGLTTQQVTQYRRKSSMFPPRKC